MKVRHRMWWIGLALALLALEGCREASRTAAIANMTEPMNWMAQQPHFYDKYIEDVVMPAPPEGGSWRWDKGTELEEYWIEDVGVDVLGDEAALIEDWEVPISHFACTGPPAMIGTIDCEVSVEAKSTQDQVSAGSWGFRRGNAYTATWVPLSAELIVKFQRVMDTASRTHHVREMKLQPLPEKTVYMFVVNRWQRLRTPAVVTGSLCRQIQDRGKSCTNGYRAEAAVFTLHHYGPDFILAGEPGPAERKRSKDYTYKLRWTPDAHQKLMIPLTRTAAYGKQDHASATGGGQLFTEGRLGALDLESDVSMGEPGPDSKGIEVKYSYTIWVTRAVQGSGDINLWVGRSAFRNEETVTEGPWIVTCTPPEQSLCNDRQAGIILAPQPQEEYVSQWDRAEEVPRLTDETEPAIQAAEDHLGMTRGYSVDAWIERQCNMAVVNIDPQDETTLYWVLWDMNTEQLVESLTQQEAVELIRRKMPGLTFFANWDSRSDAPGRRNRYEVGYKRSDRAYLHLNTRNCSLQPLQLQLVSRGADVGRFIELPVIDSALE